MEYYTLRRISVNFRFLNFRASDKYTSAPTRRGIGDKWQQLVMAGYTKLL